jgi:hypothetical protein
MAELDRDAPLPAVIGEMPQEIRGHFVDLDPAAVSELQTAWKRVMILNPTEVLYTFTFEPATSSFNASKR